MCNSLSFNAPSCNTITFAIKSRLTVFRKGLMINNCRFVVLVVFSIVFLFLFIIIFFFFLFLLFFLFSIFQCIPGGKAKPFRNSVPLKPEEIINIRVTYFFTHAIFQHGFNCVDLFEG